MTRYRTIDIACELGIHVNTVRLYEQLGLISVAPRTAKGYRIFSEKHLYQIKIARLIVHGIWPGKIIRDSGMKIVSAMLEKDLKMAYLHAYKYIETINEEYSKALAVVVNFENWGNRIYSSSSGETYNRKQTAAIIGTSPEVLRNWERRGLIEVPQKANKRVYTSYEIERLHVIYDMLQSNYKTTEILESLQLFDKWIINEIPNELQQKREEYILMMRSNWLEVYDNALKNAMKVLTLLDEIHQTL
ncbi:MAG: MerR family transcriptional regulator [Saccharofermentanales bacterium]